MQLPEGEGQGKHLGKAHYSYEESAGDKTFSKQGLLCLPLSVTGSMVVSMSAIILVFGNDLPLLLAHGLCLVHLCITSV